MEPRLRASLGEGWVIGEVVVHSEGVDFGLGVQIQREPDQIGEWPIEYDDLRRVRLPQSWDHPINSYHQNLYNFLGLTAFSDIPSRPSVDDIHDYAKGQQVLRHRFKGIHRQAGFRLAPPTKNPSMSDCCARSLQFFSFTLPP